MKQMNADLVKRYSAPVPRYTSYPTAPHFSPDVGPQDYRTWLRALPDHTRLSLYMHIPFCHTLCWYCGCSTKATHRYEPVASYLESLEAEIASVASSISPTHVIDHIHWGGGSPNVLSESAARQLDAEVRSRFRVSENAEFAVEIDPRTLTEGLVAVLAQIGVNRVSIGVQDFDPKVQAAINRQQSFAATRHAVASFRAHGVDAINIDLVYGLPHQTRDSVEATIRKVLTLEPNRIAIFGYAHLPSRIRHQRLIDEGALPDAMERFAQSDHLARILHSAGYVSIGLDHFARADDPLAAGRVCRNFQGYTSDAADALIGLGASAIGRLPQGYVQNAVATADYARRIGETGLATVRGSRLTNEDRMRGLVIERLMCDLSLSTDDLKRRFGDEVQPILEEAERLIETDRDRLIERTRDGFRITNRGRPFVRTIAARFDSYLGRGQAQHSPGI